MSDDELPKTIAERNEGLTDFWDKGYKFALEMAIGQIRGEMRWQVEMRMRGAKEAAAILSRLEVLANILEDFKKRELPVSVGGDLGETR